MISSNCRANKLRYVGTDVKVYKVSIHCVSKTSHLWLAIILTHTIRLRQFLAKCYRESKKSEYALFSHLTYLVLQHYLAKEETQKTAHRCFVRATQSNCCSAVDFLSPEPCPKAPSWTYWLQNLGYSSASMVELWQCTNTASEKCNFRVSRLVR